MFFDYKFILEFLKLFCSHVSLARNKGFTMIIYIDVVIQSVGNFKTFIYAVFARRRMFVLARNVA
jgi:hypothetical protein